MYKILVVISSASTLSSQVIEFDTVEAADTAADNINNARKWWNATVTKLY